MCRGAADCVDRESPAGSRQIELSLICALSREGSKVAALLKSTRYSVTMWEIYAWLCGIFMYVCMYVPMYACMHTLSLTHARTHTHSVCVCVCIHNPLYWISYCQCTRALTFENVCLNKAWFARRERAHAQQRLLYCLSYDPCTRALTFENVCLNEARCARRARGRCWRQRGRCVCVSGHAHCVCMYVRTYVCAYACMHACMHACIYACMHVYIHACMYVCMYAYISMYDIYTLLYIQLYIQITAHRSYRRAIGCLSPKHTHTHTRTHTHTHTHTAVFTDNCSSELSVGNWLLQPSPADLVPGSQAVDIR